MFAFSSSGYGPAAPQTNGNGAKGKFKFIQKHWCLYALFIYPD